MSTVIDKAVDAEEVFQYESITLAVIEWTHSVREISFEKSLL